MRELKLGKKPARPEAVTFKLKNFIVKSALPKPPRTFGHDTFIGKSDWGMMGNDYAGNCVWADAAHQTMLWNAAAGRTVVFDDKSVLSDYSAVTGYDPSQTDASGNNPTDQGTDMQQAASYRRKVGVLDANGVRHKVEAYMSINPGDIYEHYIATWLFGTVSLGIEFPSSAMDQFNRGKTWTVVRKSSTIGGHDIPLVARRRSSQCVTWGAEQGMSVGFFGKYNDESIAFVTEEMLTNRKSPEGFDYDGLLAMLNQLK